MMRNRQRTPEAGAGTERRRRLSGERREVAGAGVGARHDSGKERGSRWESLPSLSADAAAIDEAATEDGPPCCAFLSACVFVRLPGRWTRPRQPTRRWTTPKCGFLPRNPSLTRPSSLTPRSGRFARSCPSTGFTPPIRPVRGRLGGEEGT